MLGEWGPNGRRAINADWRKPLAWDRAAAKAGVRRRVFPSLCDWLEDRPDLDEHRSRLLELIHRTPHLDWLLLTKRPENWRPLMERLASVGVSDGDCPAEQWLAGNPPPNAWVLTSVEDQPRADERIPHLLDIPARVRGLSIEPLLRPVDVRPYVVPPCSECIHSEQGRQPDGTCSIVANEPPHGNRCHKDGINWVIVGGESGSNARPCNVAWIRSIVEQCRAASVPVFVKQLGAEPRASHYVRDVAILYVKDPKGGDPAEWPEDLRVREWPSVKAAWEDN